MAEHELKTDPTLFQAVWENFKTCEIRYNDRGYRVGDFLVLRETTYTGAEMALGLPLRYTGRRIEARVTHVLQGYGIQEGWVMLSIHVWKRDQSGPPVEEPVGVHDG